MKYMLLIYGTEAAWESAGYEECYTESTQLAHRLKEEGKYLAASPLHSVASAMSVRVREGRRMVTDGPFAETHEQLGGYFLIEARDLEEAIHIAGQVPGARLGTVEIRALREMPGLP